MLNPTSCCLPFIPSFHGRENKGSPKKRVDVRPSRTSSIEHSKEKDNLTSHSSDPENKRNSVKESDENKENLIMNSEIKEDLVFYQDEEVLNDSIISGNKNYFPNNFKSWDLNQGDGSSTHLHYLMHFCCVVLSQLYTKRGSVAIMQESKSIFASKTLYGHVSR